MPGKGTGKQQLQPEKSNPFFVISLNIILRYRFAYVRTDSEGFSSYSYQRIYNGQTLLYYLHFYDEGLFYNGFWVVNDLETGYIETEGRVFIYNSENDDCPEVVNNSLYDKDDRDR